MATVTDVVFAWPWWGQIIGYLLAAGTVARLGKMTDAGDEEAIVVGVLWPFTIPIFVGVGVVALAIGIVCTLAGTYRPLEKIREVRRELELERLRTLRREEEELRRLLE